MEVDGFSGCWVFWGSGTSTTYGDDWDDDRLRGVNKKQQQDSPGNSLLVGGWTTPFEKYKSNWESSPGRGENKKYLKPPPSKTFLAILCDLCFWLFEWPTLEGCWCPPTGGLQHWITWFAVSYPAKKTNISHLWKRNLIFIATLWKGTC